MLEDLNKTIKQIQSLSAKKAIQPFKTNDLLEELIDSQTPKWVNYLILVISGIGLFIGLWALLHSYQII